MSPSVVRLAIFAYPRRWRRRYGLELEQLTVIVLGRPQTPAKRVQILLDLVMHGFDERVRRADGAGPKAILTSMSAVLAGMFALAGGLASDVVFVPNVQIAASIHLGAGVSLHHAGRVKRARHTGHAQISVVVPRSRNPQVSIRGRSAVVINTRSGRVVSVTRSAHQP